MGMRRGGEIDQQNVIMHKAYYDGCFGGYIPRDWNQDKAKLKLDEVPEKQRQISSVKD